MPVSVSVVVEGYNESRQLGVADNTINALRKQNFPLDQVEVILAGSSAQVEEWATRYADPSPFAAIKAVASDGALYYALKNHGSEFASGPVIAFTDADVYPGPQWLA